METSQTRSFCFVSDLVDGLIKLINSNYDKPVNLGNPDEYNMYEFANLVIKAIRRSILELPEDDPKGDVE